MSLKLSNFKPRQNNWANLPKDLKLNSCFKSKHSNDSINSINLIESQLNYKKVFQKKRPPNLLHDIRSSSTNNFNSNNKIKNSLALFPINLKIPLFNKSNKNIDNKNMKTKSPNSIIKIPKTNLNNNQTKINFSIIKINTNKHNDNKHLNYTLNVSNVSSKNVNSGIFKKKIMDNNNNNNTSVNNLSNSITLINNHKVNCVNSNSNIILNNTNNTNTNKNNINHNINVRLEEAQKEKAKLNALFNEKVKDSKKINDKIKELEIKNRVLIKKINKIKKENDKYASTLDKIIKLIKLLKNNGFDVQDILKNLSSYENEESEEEDEKKEEIGESKSTIKNFSFKIGEEICESYTNKDIETNGINRSKSHKKNKLKGKDTKNIKINIKKINKNKKNQNKENEEFSFKNNKKEASNSFDE